VTREAELTAIERFLAASGATRCPAAYLAPTASGLPRAQEAQRLARLRLKAPPSKAELIRALWASLAPRSV